MFASQDVCTVSQYLCNSMLSPSTFDRNLWLTSLDLALEFIVKLCSKFYCLLLYNICHC